jgi:SAM-dependent MidA family methyltransferase
MNEVLDALPVRIVVRRDRRWLERGVVRVGDGFAFDDRPLHDDALRATAAARFPRDSDYASEINLAAEALVHDVALRLASGAMLVIDYGFPRSEYYHPQRTAGTLMGRT